MDSTITPGRFIEVWQTSSAVAEVASKLKMSKNTVRVRACRYRQRGVPLKDYPVAEIPAVDWNGLAGTRLLTASATVFPCFGSSLACATGP